MPLLRPKLCLPFSRFSGNTHAIPKASKNISEKNSFDYSMQPLETAACGFYSFSGTSHAIPKGCKKYLLKKLIRIFDAL